MTRLIIDRIIYFAPLFIFMIFLIYYLKASNYRIKAIRNIRKNGIRGMLLHYVAMIFTPKENKKIFKFYKNFLRFTKWEVRSFFLAKLSLVVFALIMIILVKTTNINIYTQKIFNSYEYKVDMIYEASDKDINKDEALKTEIALLRDMIGRVSKVELQKIPKEELQQMVIGSLSKRRLPVLTSKKNIANKVYYRLKDYYFVKRFNYSFTILFLILLYFVPELMVAVHNLFVKGDADAELVFLKKLIILNGSIKPTSYSEVLDIIVDKSKYYRQILKKIQFLRQKNTVDNKNIYKEGYLGGTNNLELKLFLEKLDQADNYDYDQAILNIENEFKTDKRERARKIKKRIEVMEIFGLVGSLVIITFMTIYLLLPWLSSYDLNSMF
ncbi:MAG: hypothetical protein MJA82_08430 [Clostridia bacterium]|nr:hypothetical protein [Clostridia bacterium]